MNGAVHFAVLSIKSHNEVSSLTPDCSAVLCLRPDCPNPVVPEGECCGVCPGRYIDYIPLFQSHLLRQHVARVSYI